MLQDKVLQLIVTYGYLGIFLSLVLGIIGLPIPDEVILAFAGFLISQGKLNYTLVILVAFIGSIVGVSISFFIGYRLGLPFLEKHGWRFYITPERLETATQWFNKYEKYTVVIGYFIPGIRQLNAYYAGIIKWPYGEFSIYAYAGGLAWVLTFVTLGMVLAEKWLVFSMLFHKYIIEAFILILLCTGIYYLIRKKT